jgi:hypothetical protein
LREPVDLDALFAALLEAGESPRAVAEVFDARPPDEDAVISLLRRAVPVGALEYLARTRPWSERPRVLAAIVLNPRTPTRVSLSLTASLRWRSLADVAMSPRVPSAVRLRAEAVLKDLLPDLRLGERITLGRLATPGVLFLLLADPDPRVLEGCLENPRLRESDLLAALRRPDVSVALLQAAAGSFRWAESYAVRLALVLEPRSPLGVALAQISSLTRRDLLRVAGTAPLAPLVRTAAQRLADGDTLPPRGGAARKRP